MVYRIIVISGIALLIIACTAGRKLSSPTLLPTTSPIVFATTTPRPSPNPTFTNTASSSSTPRPTSTPALLPLSAIDSVNASRVVQLAKVLDDAGGIAISPDRRVLATAGNDGNLRLWDISNPISPISSLLLSLPTAFHKGVTSAAFNSEGQTIAIGTVDETVVEIDLQSHQSLVHDWPLAIVMSVAFSPEGNLLAAGGADGKVRIWETNSASLLFEVQAHNYWVSGLAFAPEGNILASGSSSDGLIKLWNMKSTTPLQTLEDGKRFIYDLAFGPDGNSLLSGGCKVIILTGNGSSSAVCDGGILTLWSLADNKPFRINGEALSTISSVAFTPDGGVFASGVEDGRIWLWDTDSQQVLAVLGGHTAKVTHLQFSQDGCILVSVGIDNAFRLWGVNEP